MMRFSALLSALTLFLATQLTAQEYRSVMVTSQPAGATIMLNRATVGVTPAKVVLSSGAGVSEIVIAKEGYEAVSFEFSDQKVPDAIETVLSLRRTVIPVTLADDREPAFDGEITLREALLYANGSRRPAGTDRVLIDGPVGADRADDIMFSVGRNREGSVITVTSPLPPLTGPADRLIGPTKRATIAVANGFALRGAGLVMGPDTKVERLILDGFDIGLSAEGYGTMEARDISAIGGFVGFRASGGAELLLSGADAINLAFNTSAYDDGIVDGLVENLSQNDLENMTLYSGPPGDEGYTVLEGWIEPVAATNLFVRQKQPRPLREVEGLEAFTTSYDLYQIFGFGQSDQRWPRHVYDGIDGDFFRWSFTGPAGYEYMYVMSQRPMRTSKFVLYHLQVDSKLVKYRFSLLGRDRSFIQTFEIETDGTVDEIAIDPEVDFFGFQINVVEATGNSPGFTEIEAEVLDSDAYAPLSVSRRRAIFPRPVRGTRGLVEINGELRPMGEAVFGDVAPVPYPQRANAFKPVQRVSVTLPQNATVEDFRTALEKAAASDVGEIVIPGTLEIDASLGEISASGLRLTGGGDIRSTDGSDLRFRDGNGIRLDNLTATGGGIRVRDSPFVVLEAMDFKEFVSAIAAKNSNLVVSNSSFAGGSSAYYGESSSLAMIGSLIEDVAVGISAGPSDPMTLVGNTIFAQQRAIELREGEYISSRSVIFVGNQVAPESPATATGSEGTRSDAPSYIFSSTSIVGENKPENLGLIPGFDLIGGTVSWMGNGVQNLRTGGAPTQLRVVEFTDPNIRCLLSADASVAGAAKPVLLQQSATAILHDSDVSLLCRNDAGSARVTLPVATAPDAPVPAVARLAISLDEGFEEPEDEGMASSVIASVSAKPIGSGRPFPELGAKRAGDAKRSLIYSLVDAGDPAGAFQRAYDYFSRSPRDNGLAELVLYAADAWSGALENEGLSDEALELLSDLADSDTAPPGAQALVVGAYLRRGTTLLDQQLWADARRHYRLALARDPARETARQNIVYAYQEELRGRFRPELAAETIAWVDAQSLAYPDEAEGLREVAGILLANLVVDAINNQRVEEGLFLASAHLKWVENERTINNLRAAFQDYALEAVSRGQGEAVLARLDELIKEHGTRPDLEGILANVFNNAAVNAVESGDFAAARAAARALYDSNPTADAADLLAYTYGRQAESVEAAGDIAGALRLLVAALEDYPDIGRLKQLGQSIGNRAGISANEAGDAEAAVKALETTIDSFGTSDMLSQNLRIIYANWAVNSANSGNLDLALRVAKAGQERFPDEATFAKVIDYVLSRQ